MIKKENEKIYFHSELIQSSCDLKSFQDICLDTQH